MALTEDTVAAAAARDRKKNTEELGAPVAQGTAETPRHPETETFKFAVSRVNPSIPDGEGAGVVPARDDAGAALKKELNMLRDSYMGRLPAPQRSVTVSFAWKELWGKASRYLSHDDLKQLGEALVFAAQAHGDQMRASGEPYVIHPVYVTSILADMRMDLPTLQAGLLHDVLEDTPVTADEMKNRFGATVEMLVDGVTKLGKLPFKTFEDYQAENLRKMFLVMAKDIRVVLIKLADRTHNMRSLGALRRDKQQRIAKETLEIYAPLAHRLGIYQVKRTLEDLAFKYYDPTMYYDIKRRVKKRLPEREAIVNQAMEVLGERLRSIGIEAHIKGRAKHFYSIFEKMNRKKLSVEQLYDLLALRVIVNDVTTCYTVLGIVHTLWKPIPGQFDDYIANPKNNMYRSLHTTVMGPQGEPLEVQIRTWEMHWLAEYGVAAHWRYKEGQGHIDELDQKLEWIRKTLENGPETNSQEFMERLRDDVLTSDVFVFTPEGDVKSLPRGSCPVDFAYAVHSRIGEQYVGAMVNNRIVAADYVLHNGDIVKIMTSPQGKPSRDWANFVKSSKAKSRIRSYFKRLDSQEKNENIQRGRELLERELKTRLGENFKPVDEVMPCISRIAHDVNCNNAEDVLAAIGSGAIGPAGIARKVCVALNTPVADAVPQVPEATGQKPHGFAQKGADVIVEGASGIVVTLAHCCQPVPGDAIVGFSTKVRGIMVHRENCPRIEKAAPDRLIPVSWGNTDKKKYDARIVIDALDRPGLFGDIAQVCGNGGINITSVMASQMGSGNSRMKMDVAVQDLEQLYSIIARLNGIRDVINVYRG
ncbi:bifunctional (p)ppGpp synthetase/guanosine-3',5'-bis(diphosphate) 3'-pyrophosphohydrolase [Pyramidobacter piscolens]|uniref:RelA/SpoT family protein n=2 Tax=Pyramidobacter piscolens TaxID=638849 RepID=UPI002587CAFC|nr:bifunctional (p)ppGpp synthetase/guanosine-3',5'-bis(diphosphate) 3'-pyrophosphohydrolase [Pyramidobacter piscolens]